MDTRFILEIDMLGNVCYDTYDDVTGGFITARRVEQEYRELVNQIFEKDYSPFRYSLVIIRNYSIVMKDSGSREPLTFLLFSTSLLSKPK